LQVGNFLILFIVSLLTVLAVLRHNVCIFGYWQKNRAKNETICPRAVIGIIFVILSTNSKYAGMEQANT
jgi:hypothetical protein